jgi:hypothetical protein
VLNQASDTRSLFESLAQAAGLGVVFGAKFPARPISLQFENMTVPEALDFLAMQSGNVWEPLDDHTILVFEDTQQNRRNYETQVVRTILLPTTMTAEELNNLTNILRTAFAMRGIFQSSIAKALVLHDTPNRVELVEKVVRALTPNPNSIVSLTVPAPGFAEARSFSSASAARSMLNFQGGPVFMQLNQNVTSSYQTLAGRGGITIRLDPRVDGAAPVALRLDDVDYLDALDRLSLQTGNFWTVVDSNTVLVAPDTPQSRQELEPQMSSMVSLKTLKQGLVTELVNVLRTALMMRQVDASGAYEITMKDTPQRIAVAGQIIANLDRP